MNTKSRPKRGKARNKKAFALACLTVFLIANTASCAKSLDMAIANSSQATVGAGHFLHGMSICDSGLLYQESQNFHYYDVATKTDYILCAVPNCRHNSKACSAWFDNAYMPTGLALYGDHVYAMKENESSFDAVQMDITGENQRILASLPKGESKPGEWVLKYMQDVMYSSGSMWIVARIGNVVQDDYGSRTGAIESSILYGIRLSDGKVTKFNDFPDPSVPKGSEQNPDYAFCALTPSALLYTKSWLDPPLLGEEQFLESECFERFADCKDPYYDYFDWHTLNAAKTVETYIYCPACESSELFDRETINSRNGSFLPSWGFAGYHKDSILTYDCNWDSPLPQNQVFAYDIQTKERKLLLDVSNGGLISTRNDSLSSLVIDGKLLYCIFTDDNMAGIYSLDLDTGETAFVYQDVAKGEHTMTRPKRQNNSNRLSSLVYAIAMACLNIFLASLVITASCARSLDRVISNSSQVVVGAGHFDRNPSVCDSCLLFQGRENFHYYDFAAKTDYVLCAVPNCRHNSEACAAWFDSLFPTTGLAMYGDQVYAIKENNDTSSFNVIQMDITGGKQKILVSLPRGDFRPGEWVLSSIQNHVFYASDTMWFEAVYSHAVQDEYGIGTAGIDCAILYGIGLSDGHVIKLNDFPDPGDPAMSEHNPSFDFAAITPFALLYTKSWCVPPLLGEAQFAQSEFFDRFADSRDPYYDYMEWHEFNASKTVETYVWNPESRTSELLRSESVSLYQDEYGTAFLSDVLCVGYYQDSLLMFSNDWNSPNGADRVFAFDLTTKEETPILEIPNGSLISIGYGVLSSLVVDGNKLLYFHYTDNGMADVYAYNLDTGESSYLYQDVGSIRFRILGETPDSILLTVNGDGFDTYCKISKDDYFAGNIDAAEMLFSR